MDDPHPDDGGLRADMALVEQSDPNGPRIVELTTNKALLVEYDSLTVNAIVTDPDGISDLIGGSLVDPGGSTYGTFQTSAEEGAYSLTLTWYELTSVKALTGAASGVERTLRARFFDQAGHVAEREVRVTYGCGAGSSSTLLCNGECYADSAQRCGSCDNRCDSDQICEARTCVGGDSRGPSIRNIRSAYNAYSELVEVTADISDPDGAGTIDGATIERTDGIGNNVTMTDRGAWFGEVDISEWHDADEGQDVEARITAVDFDGNEASATFTMRLYCGDEMGAQDGELLCGGRCAYLGDPDFEGCAERLGF